MKNTISQYDDLIDVRDLIERFEELESELEELESELEELEELESELEELTDATQELKDWHESDDGKEFSTLKTLLEELSGNGGDEKWRGDWYPSTLVRDSYFETYMDEMLEDCGDLPKNLPSYLIITVDYVALKMDYSSVEFNGVGYWYR